MNFLKKERKRVIERRNQIFRDPGGGEYKSKNREFVLSKSNLNLWAGIRDDAIDYFRSNRIVWWGGNKNKPSGHLLSSQISCINHLFFLRQRKDISSKILKEIRSDVIEAVWLDSGFVEFEAIGKENYLGEKSHIRGANTTSIDVVMVGKKQDGKNLLVMIEWKYTESYRDECMYIEARSKIYDPFLLNVNCPIQVENLESLYYEPFYQLMRQTLLGWQMVINHEYDCDDYIHLHVIPNENLELIERITSPGLNGSTMSNAWKKVLRNPEQYLTISPKDFLNPIKDCRIQILSITT